MPRPSWFLSSGLAVVSSLALSSVALLLPVNLSAQAQLNPNPRILGENPATRVQRTPTEIPPLPEQQAASAVITPIDGKVNLRLVNRTGARILYQVIGETQQRVLAGRSQITLQALEIPTNITFYRQDRGFLLVQPQASAGQSDTLDVSFTETTDFSLDRTTLTINPAGEVRLN